MVLVICAVIQLDAVAMIIPNQMAAMVITPVIWAIGAFLIAGKAKKENVDSFLYHKVPFSTKDGVIFCFVIAGGITMAASNYLYAGLKPLFVRELLTGYPLYTIRNVFIIP